jgi:N-acetylmuramoyl-L-alanine amidase
MVKFTFFDEMIASLYNIIVKFAELFKEMNIITRYITLFAMVLAFIGMSPNAVHAKAAKADTSKPFTLVIDPGHGGKDYGCIGNITNEKTIVLDVAKRFGELVNKRLPGVKVVYTRKDDNFISLQGRADVANNANGDLFISIHVNSVDKSNKGRTTIQGAQVYTLGLHKNDNNLSVAMRENAVIELENDYSTKYQGFDPNSSESYIIFELNQNRHVAHSIELANDIQHELVTTAGRANKDVRQAGFWVLWATSMPSVLVELDFICNPTSEQFMQSSDGKDKCAESLYNAFKKYYERHSVGENGKSKCDTSIATTTTSSKKAEQKAEAKAEPKSEPTTGATTYHIQFLTSSTKLKDSDSRLKKVNDTNFYQENGLYKYYSGTYSSFNEAKSALTEIRKSYPEAFIFRMRDGKRLYK